MASSTSPGPAVRRATRRWILVGLIAVCAMLDQVIKYGVEASVPLGGRLPVTGFFNIVHSLNPGAAFSFLANQSGWQTWLLATIAIVVSIALTALIMRNPGKPEAVAYALITGGAVGNVIDRLKHGAVVDWLDFYWGSTHWPAFNLADVWIVIGTALIVLFSFRKDLRSLRSD